MRLNFLSFSNLTLLVALSLSSVAAWYSIIGLTAIFAGAVIPIIIMGSILEVGKITTTVWLRKYWYRASMIIKSYLVFAVFFLAVLTSMGIFGFLSKAHMDQGIVSGDSQAKVAIYDEKISIQKDIVKSSKSMLAQMDQQVNDIMTKGDSEKSVERSVTIRKQQAKERASLQKDIENANKEVQRLNEERAPFAAESRKIEAEVGPIKYIAALIYGDNPDADLLERAVRWVIIMIVAVFDPLALVLVVAANQSKEWDDNDDVDEENKLREKVAHDNEIETILEAAPKYEQDDGPLTDEQVEQLKKSVEAFNDKVVEEPVDEFTEEEIVEINDKLQEAKVVEEVEVEIPEEYKSTLAQHPYLTTPFVHFKDLKPISSSIKEYEEPAIGTSPALASSDTKILAIGIDPIDRPGDYLNSEMTIPPDLPYKSVGGGYVDYQGKHMSVDALKGMHPEFFSLRADANKPVNSSFGSKFPDDANKGDVFVRVDVLPNKVFKFSGNNWIEINKDTSNTYLYNTKYVEFLIDSIQKGEYDIELLSENERSQIEDHLKIQKNNEKNG